MLNYTILITHNDSTQWLCMQTFCNVCFSNKHYFFNQVGCYVTINMSINKHLNIIFKLRETVKTLYRVVVLCTAWIGQHSWYKAVIVCRKWFCSHRKWQRFLLLLSQYGKTEEFSIACISKRKVWEILSCITKNKVLSAGELGRFLLTWLIWP